MTDSAFEQGHSGWARVSQNGTLSVKTVDLDSEVEDLKLKQIDVLKIDIEGHENRAIIGMCKSLAGRVIKSAFVELHLGYLSVAELSEIVSAFKDNGYRGYFLIENEANAKRALSRLQSGAIDDPSFLLEEFDERRIDDIKSADSRIHVLWTV